MEFFGYIIDLFLHLDRHLAELVAQYGTTTYVILFLVIFAETGLVVTPFLPGDSLLFAAGSICALGALDPILLSVLLIIAAIAGDATNYWIGDRLGHLFTDRERPLIKQEYLDRTHAFYEKHGGKTIILARFLPIVRTFAPFVAGVGTMTYSKFFTFNVVGALAWIISFVSLGYFFGTLPIVKKNFSLVILAIIIISAIPPVWEIIQHQRKKRKG